MDALEKINSYIDEADPDVSLNLKLLILHLLPKINMFCALSQNNQHLLEK